MSILMQAQYRPPRRLSPGIAMSHAVVPLARRQAQPIIHLQRAIGNQAVQRLLIAKADNVDVRSEDVGQLGGTQLQRRPAAETEVTGAPPIVHEVLRSPGQPLDWVTRSSMERRFCRDFSQVRLHADSTAAESAWAVHARAYTVGPHVVLGAGQHGPTSRDGQFVLAHELAHVVQQSHSAEPPVAVDSATTCHDVTVCHPMSSRRPAISPRTSGLCLQKIDLTRESLGGDDIAPVTALTSNDYVDNNIETVGLRALHSGLSVRYVAVTVKYKDGSVIDIPTTPAYLQQPKSPGRMQVIRYRRHTPTGKIVPVTWRGRPEQMPEDPGGPFGSVIFAKDITPNIIQGYDDAATRRAFVFAGEIGQIWSAALGARGLLQMFSATQAARIAAAGRSALGLGGAAARSAATRELERQALEAEEKVVAASGRRAVAEAEKEVLAGGEQKAVAETEKQAVAAAEKKVVSEAGKRGVEIVDSQGKAIGEFDQVLKGKFIEEKSARGLGTLHPKTRLPVQTADDWAKKQVHDKTVTRIENLLNRATATRPTVSGSPSVPTLAEIRGIRNVEFRIEAATAEVQAAVNKQLTALRVKYPGWTFTAVFGQ